ncbi:MAG: DUF1318 domain-containing protein [Deltaproteobacteria bacterium RBG_13_49_15]|nr:MAG: DUF1318 domain-containing protein [Deltaproteobacteria bacterium RBG_13_49_15]
MKKRFIAVLALLCGCTLAEVKVDVLSERTALENQILGTYNTLDREMLLLASVRSVDSSGRIASPQKQSREHQDAVSAMQVQAFHADDLQLFKRLQWVGENNHGLLTMFQMTRENIPDDLKPHAMRFTQEEFESVVSQINAARETIMARVVSMNETIPGSDLSKIREIFGKLNAENARPGEKIQTEDDKWTIKR